MKRFLSIALCVMMLVSVFSIGTSAMVPTSYEVVTSPAAAKVNYAAQNGGDDSTDFTTTAFNGTVYGAAEKVEDPKNAENDVIQLTGDTAMLVSTKTEDQLTANDREMTFKFKVYPVGQAETINVGFVLPTIVRGTWPSGWGGKDVYVLIGHPNFTADAWNNVEVTMSAPETYSVSNGGFPANNTGIAVTAKVNGTDLTVNTATPGRTPTAGRVGVQGGLVSGRNDTSFVGANAFYLATGGSYAGTTAPEGGRKVYFDDIEVYKPAVAAVTETVNYTAFEGDVIYTNTNTLTVDAAAIGENNAEVFNKSASKKAHTLSYTKNVGAAAIISFDARAVTSTYPLCLQISDGVSTETTFKVNIMPTAKIGSDWYSYKIVTNLADSGKTPNFGTFKIYRKKADTTDAYMTLAWKTEYLSHGSSGSGAGKYIQLGYWQNGTIDANFTSTAETAAQAKWEVKNIQMVDIADGGAVTGKATAKGDETADVKVFYTTKPGATTPIVAVYDGTKLVDIEYAAAATQSEGEFNANVDYVAGNTVKMFIWDGIATGVPVLSNPIPITVQ